MTLHRHLVPALHRIVKLPCSRMKRRKSISQSHEQQKVVLNMASANAPFTRPSCYRPWRAFLILSSRSDRHDLLVKPMASAHTAYQAPQCWALGKGKKADTGNRIRSAEAACLYLLQLQPLPTSSPLHSLVLTTCISIYTVIAGLLTLTPNFY